MVAIRLDEKPDQRERVLDLTFFLYTDRDLYLYLLDSITWNVSPGDILISPGQCKSLWRQLQDETVDTIRQAIAAKVKSLDHILVLSKFSAFPLIIEFVVSFAQLFCSMRYKTIYML